MTANTNQSSDTKFIYFCKNNLSDDDNKLFIVKLNDELSVKKETDLMVILNQGGKDSYISKNYNFNLNKFKFIIGPKPNWTTSWTSNALNIFKLSGLTEIDNIIEISFINTYNYDYDPMMFNNYLNEVIGLGYYFDPDKDTYSPTSDSNNDYKSNPVIDYFINIYFLSNIDPDDTFHLQKIDIELENETSNLGIDSQLMSYYKENLSLNRIELFDLAQCNSEHARHWVFNATNIINGVSEEKSLFKLIKETNDLENNESVLAFSDNASAITGYQIYDLLNDKISLEKNKELFKVNYFLTSNAETHNFPTSISPFPGAATGTGGRIRDTISVGRGGRMMSGFIGYSVGNISGSINNNKYPHMSPKDILIQGSNGASDYGNKIGEPLICGFTREFEKRHRSKGKEVYNCNYEFVKPILYTAGNGLIESFNIKKSVPMNEDLIIQIGGPAYKIGLGGGSASSRDLNKQNSSDDFNAVQRGDPEVENRLCRFVSRCSNLQFNPITTIHDQGSGGMANVTKEIIYPNGGSVNLQKVNIGDKTMNSYEIWNSEYQEQCTILINKNNLELVKKIADSERLELRCIGEIDNSGSIKVFNGEDKVVDLNLEVLDKIPVKKFTFDNIPRYLETNINLNNTKFESCFEDLDIYECFYSILHNASVCSKRFLVQKVDRSVSGLVAQQQCVGPWLTPLSDYSMNLLSTYDYRGVASSLGEKPISGIFDVESMVDATFAECITNLFMSCFRQFSDIKLQANWMWTIKDKYNHSLLIRAVKRLNELCKLSGIGIDGGKDSLSMTSYFDGEVVQSPNTLVLKSYVKIPDVRKRVTPYFKNGGDSLVHLDFSCGLRRLGGSIFHQDMPSAEFYYYGNNIKHPRLDDKIISSISRIYEIIEKYIKSGCIVSGHDISDGGISTTISEMAISSFYGAEISLYNNIVFNKNYNTIKTNCVADLFAEEPGMVLEFVRGSSLFIKEINSLFYSKNEINENAYRYRQLAKYIGKTTFVRNISFIFNDDLVFKKPCGYIRKAWEATSFELEKKQCNNEMVSFEWSSICNYDDIKYNYYIPEKIVKSINYSNLNLIRMNNNTTNKKVCILRETGSNSDKEMADAFKHAGFKVYDITTKDLLECDGSIIMDFDVIAFVGGFSFSDVFTSAYGWYKVIKSNNKVHQELLKFYNTENKYSIGICNGLQLMSHLDFLPKCKLVENVSGKFESRFVNVKICENEQNKNIFTDGMNNLHYGINIAHKEGCLILNNKEDERYGVMRYCDFIGNVENSDYPYNPNGSQFNIAGLISKNGRHLGMMPHIERTFLNVHCQYDGDNKLESDYSPWFCIFKNLFDNC